MPSTASTAPGPIRQDGLALEHLRAMSPQQRLAAYRSGLLSHAERALWARTFPDEVPVVNGEVEWIALGLADLD